MQLFRTRRKIDGQPNKATRSSAMVRSIFFLKFLIPILESGCQQITLHDQSPITCDVEALPLKGCLTAELNPENRDVVFEHYIMHLEGTFEAHEHNVATLTVSDINQNCASIVSFDISATDSYIIISLGEEQFGINWKRITINTGGEFEGGTTEVTIRKVPVPTSLTCGQVLFNGHVNIQEQVPAQIEDEYILTFSGIVEDNVIFVLRPAPECGTPLLIAQTPNNETTQIGRYGTYWFSIQVRNLTNVDSQNGGADLRIWRECAK